MTFLSKVLPFLLLVELLMAEDRNEVFRLGVNCVGGITTISDLNKIANIWLQTKDDSSSSDLVQVSHKGAEVSVNIEYGLEPFAAFTLWNIWQIGGKIDYLLSPHIYNLMFKDTLKIELQTYVPSVYTSLKLGNLELGGGLLYGISTVHWNDNYFGYASTWSAADWGYELKAAISPHGKYLGFNLSAGYRHLVFRNVVDNSGRKIYFTDTGKQLQLDMSGFVINLGLYYALTFKRDVTK